VTTAPTYAIDAVANPWGAKWGGAAIGSAATVTFSFLTSVPSYYPANAEERSNFGPMNAAQKQAARDAFALYSEVANLTFVEVSAGTGSINLGTANLGSGIAGWAYYPRTGYSGSNDGDAYGDVWITNRYSSYGNPTKGSWENLTLIHEIGHAIGLKHPGNYDAGGGGTPGPYLPSAEDSHQYTVMSYYSGLGYGGNEPITPQLYDIAAVQYLYGANTSTRSGNDTYTFSTSLQIKTIWDAGGNDTFDASIQGKGVTIDLHDGSFSSIGGTNNIAIAFGVQIENAVGGNFNDLLRANDAGDKLSGGGGNDTLIGGAGNDTLTGGSGTDKLTGSAAADTFVFASGDSSAISGRHDLITDFMPGTDLIDLRGFDADPGTAGLNPFRFLGPGSFDGLAGALGYFFDSVGNVTVLQGDTNGDKIADFAIDLSGNLALAFSAFALGSVQTNVPLTLMGTSGSDTLFGGAANDTLSGLAGNDTLIGNSGDDTLDGGTGADAMTGGTGNDSYVIDNAGDMVTEAWAPAFAPPSGWTIKGTADLNGDGECSGTAGRTMAARSWESVGNHRNSAEPTVVDRGICGPRWRRRQGRSLYPARAAIRALFQRRHTGWRHLGERQDRRLGHSPFAVERGHRHGDFIHQPFACDGC
jgi:Ca2+-binding RTX toxin-like protein